MAYTVNDDTDLEMTRYNEAADIKKYSGVSIDNVRGGYVQHDPIRKVEGVYIDLPSGGKLRVGDRPVTPVQMAQTDVLAQDQKPDPVAEVSTSPIPANGRFPIESIMGAGDAAQVDDYLAAGYTEAEVQQYNQFLVGQNTPQNVPVKLTADQMAEYAQQPGAQMVMPRDPSLAENITGFISDTLDPNREQTGGVMDTVSSVLQDLIGKENLTPSMLNQISKDSTQFLDFFGPGVGAAISIDEGTTMIDSGYSMMKNGLAQGDTGMAVSGLIDATLGSVFTTLGVAELVPMVKGLTKPAKDLLRQASPAVKNLLADTIGASRAIAQGDKEMLMEIFQPAGTPRSLGAAAPTDTPAVTGSSNPLRAGGAENEKARQEIVLLAGQRDPSRPKPFVKLEDIATFYEQNHLAQYGRKLDQSNDQDLDLVVNAASDEVKYQLNQSVSGKGWYDSDVRKTFEIVSRIPGLESLATSETDRVIMSAIMAPTSIGRLVTENTRVAIAAMLGYKRTGRIPTSPPAANTVTEGIQNAGWGFKQGSVASGMQVISHLVDTLGPDGFADWWLSPHSLKELTGVRQAAGLSGPPSGLSGGQDSMHLGAMVIGDKTGKFSLNINGYEGTTKDVWFSRSYNRHFGDMRDSKGELAGGPRNTVERRRMEEFTRKVQGNLQDQGLSEQDIQAILWYYEQNLTTDLGVLSRPGAFSEEAEKIYGQLRPGVRAGDATQTAAEPAGLEGFRGIGATQRTVRAERRLPERVDPRNPEGQTGPYTREVGSGNAGDGLLVLQPNPQSKARYTEAGLSLPAIREVPAQQSAAQYNADMTGAMQGHEFGAQVEVKSAEDLAQARLFRTEDGSGFAIKPDGDIVAVFAGAQSAKGSGYSMLQAAVAAGGRKLDAFDTYLPKIYETVGFRPVARLPWNDEFAPPNWDKKTFSEFNNGEPDVVFFVYDPDYYGGAVDVPTFNDYDKAVAEQDRQLQSLEGQK
jgi:hypothetical protein